MDPNLWDNTSPYTAPSEPADAFSLSAVDSSGNDTVPTKSLSLGQGLQVGGSVLGAYGDILAGQEAQQADNYNAQLALEQGQFEVSDLATEEVDTLSTQRAMYGKAGVTMSGSPLDTAVNTASQFELDKQIATYNAQSKANMDVYEGRVAKQQGQVKAGESLLSSGAMLALAFA